MQTDANKYYVVLDEYVPQRVGNHVAQELIDDDDDDDDASTE